MNQVQQENISLPIPWSQVKKTTDCNQCRKGKRAETRKRSSKTISSEERSPPRDRPQKRGTKGPPPPIHSPGQKLPGGFARSYGSSSPDGDNQALETHSFLEKAQNLEPSSSCSIHNARDRVESTKDLIFHRKSAIRDRLQGRQNGYRESLREGYQTTVPYHHQTGGEPPTTPVQTGLFSIALSHDQVRQWKNNSWTIRIVTATHAHCNSNCTSLGRKTSKEAKEVKQASPSKKPTSFLRGSVANLAKISRF